MDTFQAVECMGLRADVRKYTTAKEILDYFQIGSIKCIANNPDKISSMENEGIVASEVLNIPVTGNVFSRHHLEAKISRGTILK